MEFNERDDFVHNLLYTYCRWFWPVAVLFVFLFTSVFVMAWLITPVWEAKTYLLIEPTLLPVPSRFADPMRPKQERLDAAYAYQAAQILEGKEMALSVVDAFHLDERLRRKSEEPSGSRERVQAGIASVLEGVISGVMWVLRVESEQKDPAWRDKAARGFYDGLFAWIAAKPVNDTDILEMVVMGDKPSVANEISEFMVERLREQLTLTARAAGLDAISGLERQLVGVLELHAEAEIALQSFVETNGGVDPEGQIQLKSVERETLQSQHDRLRAERGELERQIAQLPGLKGMPALSERLLRSDVVRQLRANLHDLLLNRASLIGELTEAHPEVADVENRIQWIVVGLGHEIRSSLATVEAEFRHAEEQLVLLDRDLRELTRMQLEYSRLVSERDRWQSMRRELQSHVDMLRVSVMSGVSPMSVKVVDRMRVSDVKGCDMPSWVIVAILAILFACGGSVVLPPFIEYWRDPIRGPVDLRRNGMVPLVVIPAAGSFVGKWLKRLVRRNIVHGVDPCDVGSRWHDLAATLVLASREKGAKYCVVMTGVRARESRTRICEHVVSQAASMGCRSVLLSVRSPEPGAWPSLDRLEVPHECGQGVSPAFSRLCLPEFFGALPRCGSSPADWVSDFDLMVIDAPDAGKQLQTYLAERSDGVVLVVDSRVQSLTEVASHFRAMDASVKRTLGVILNRHSSPLPAWLDRWGDRPV